MSVPDALSRIRIDPEGPDFEFHHLDSELLFRMNPIHLTTRGEAKKQTESQTAHYDVHDYGS